MKLTSISYFLTEGVEGVFKNKSMAFASIATITICIFMLGMAFFVLQNIEFNVQNIETDVNITAFLDEKMTEEQIIELKGVLLKNPQIKSIDYISKDEALKRFLGEEGLPADEFMDDIKMDNPLRASFEIKLNNNKDEKVVAGSLSNVQQIVKLNTPREAMSLILELKNFMQTTSSVVIGILIVVGVILIGNTIELTVYIRKNEIKVMKYIGATDWFVRWPFIIEGMFIGLLGTVIPLIVLFFLYSFFVNMFLSTVPSGSEGFVVFMPISDIYQSLVPLALSIGLGMGVIGSLIIIRKHLRA